MATGIQLPFQSPEPQIIFQLAPGAISEAINNSTSIETQTTPLHKVIIILNVIIKVISVYFINIKMSGPLTECPRPSCPTHSSHLAI